MGLFDLNKIQEENLTAILQDKYKKVKVSELAIEKAVNMIANAIAKGEIKVYRKIGGKVVETVDEMYFQLNILPNPNETGTDFWKKAINTLIRKKECLIVRNKIGMYVADSFDESIDVLKGKTYSNVQVSCNGTSIQLKPRFKSDDCLDLKMTNGAIINLIENLNNQYDDLIGSAIGAYKKGKASKYIMDIPTQVSMRDKKGNIITANDYAEKVKGVLNSDDVEVLLSGAGIDIQEMKNEVNAGNNEIKEMIDQVFTTTALAFDIPVAAFMGTISEKSDASNEFMTYGVSWIVELLNDSFNAKYVGQEAYLQGERVMINISNFKHRDLFDVAGNLDKLYQDGWSHNEILKLLGEQPIDEEWANVHHTTKNYTDVNSVSE